MPVRAYLAILILAMFLPGVMFVASDLSRQREEAETRVKQNLEAIAVAVVNGVSVLMQDYSKALANFAARPLVRELNPARCDPGIHDFAQLHPQFVNIHIRSRDGTPLCRASVIAPPRAPLAQYPWFGDVFKSEGVYVSDALVGALTGRWVSLLVRPIRNAGAEADGAVFAAVSLSELSERLFGARRGSAHRGAVWRRRGGDRVGMRFRGTAGRCPRGRGA